MVQQREVNEFPCTRLCHVAVDVWLMNYCCIIVIMITMTIGTVMANYEYLRWWCLWWWWYIVIMVILMTTTTTMISSFRYPDRIPQDNIPIWIKSRWQKLLSVIVFLVHRTCAMQALSCTSYTAHDASRWTLRRKLIHTNTHHLDNRWQHIDLTRKCEW